MGILRSNIDQRYIKGNRSTSFPRYCLFYDCETTPHKTETGEYHTFSLGTTAFIEYTAERTRRREDWKQWTDAEQICRYINECCYANKTLYVFGHNIYFDLQSSQFFHHFPRWGWKLDFLYDKGLTYILVIENGKRTIKVLSTTNWYDFALDKVGRDLGIPKLEIDFSTTDEKSLWIYNRRDVEITVAAIESLFDFCATRDLGKFGITRASQSYNAYRHRFMQHKIAVHTDEELIAHERNGYFGGRTEAFFIGPLENAPYTLLDVNSMYPFVMRNQLYPTRVVMFSDDESLHTLAKRLETHSVIARVKVKTDIPVYPYRIKSKVIFPIGTFTTTLCTPELQYAIDHNHIIEVYELSMYIHEPIFTEYVDYFYPLKVEAKRAGLSVHERMAKLFLNSLYGKFGQKRAITEIYDAEDITDYYRMECYDAITGEYWIEYALFGKRIVEHGSESTNKTFVAIPAHVTAFARMYLWKLITTVGIDNVLYCDTDSLLIESKHNHLLTEYLHDTRLGALSVSRKVSTGHIYGVKDYEFDGAAKIKGIPKHAEKNSDGSYTYNQFLSQRSHMRLSEVSRFILKKITKRLSRKYDKGVIDQNGRVHPIDLS